MCKCGRRFRTLDLKRIWKAEHPLGAQIGSQIVFYFPKPPLKGQFSGNKTRFGVRIWRTPGVLCLSNNRFWHAKSHQWDLFFHCLIIHYKWLIARIKYVLIWATRVRTKIERISSLYFINISFSPSGFFLNIGTLSLKCVRIKRRAAEGWEMTVCVCACEWVCVCVSVGECGASMVDVECLGLRMCVRVRLCNCECVRVGKPNMPLEIFKKYSMWPSVYTTLTSNRCHKDRVWQ